MDRFLFICKSAPTPQIKKFHFFSFKTRLLVLVSIENGNHQTRHQKKIKKVSFKTDGFVLGRIREVKNLGK